jgi:hypothetical protein
VVAGVSVNTQSAVPGSSPSSGWREVEIHQVQVVPARGPHHGVGLQVTVCHSVLVNCQHNAQQPLHQLHVFARLLVKGVQRRRLQPGQHQHHASVTVADVEELHDARGAGEEVQCPHFAKAIVQLARHLQRHLAHVTEFVVATAEHPVEYARVPPNSGGLEPHVDRGGHGLR